MKNARKLLAWVLALCLLLGCLSALAEAEPPAGQEEEQTVMQGGEQAVVPDEEPPAALRALTARYAPDLTLLLKTPARAAALTAAAPWTADAAIGDKTLFYPFRGGSAGGPIGL